MDSRPCFRVKLSGQAILLERTVNIFRLLKSVHGWLGIMILPWILVAGVTGFYLNHSRAIFQLFPSFAFDEAQFAQHPARHEGTQLELVTIAGSFFPDENLGTPEALIYHDNRVWALKNRTYRVYLSRETGHFWVKTPFTRRTYAPDGQKLHTKYYLGRILKTLHTRGWVGVGLPSLLADITSFALMIFSMSGMYLFLSPRIRKWQGKRRARRLAAERAAMPAPDTGLQGVFRTGTRPPATPAE